MLRVFIVAQVSLLVVAGGAFGDEFTATLKKVEGNSITLTVTVPVEGKKKKKMLQDQVFAAADDCRVFLAKYNKLTKAIEPGDEIAGGLKSPVFRKIDGDVGARVIRDESTKQIVELRLFKLEKKSK